MRHNKEDIDEVISSEYTQPIEFWSVVAVDTTNGINILDALFPTQSQAEKYSHEEQSKWEESSDESITLIVRKGIIDIIDK